ncbi:MAG: FlgD immunoglobulin-like domain containing protein [Candidatus Latescibacterota bacterium]|nr:FlgD immunoglobulin-like domain containing protein [Candidatus Latescibacterota bacterium]
MVEPLRATSKLFDTHPYLTRLYTTLSAEEMTVDPMFDVNSDLPEVSNMRTARAHWECEGIDPENVDLTKLVLVVTLKDGRQIRSQPFTDAPWPLAREAGVPAAAVVERLDTSGPPMLVQRLTAIDDKPGPALPTEYGLHLAYPNPFNAATVIPFTIPDGVGSATVRLTIHDLLGQRVRTLVQGTHPPGRRQVLWDGLSDDGKGMATGVYLVRLEVGSTRRAQKILYVRQEWVGPLFYEAFHEACPNCLEQIVV